MTDYAANNVSLALPLYSVAAPTPATNVSIDDKKTAVAQSTPAKDIGKSTKSLVYTQRGYYVLDDEFEYYTSVGAPSNTPPSGHTLQQIVVLYIYREM